MKWPFLLPILLPEPLMSRPEHLVDGVGRLLAKHRQDAPDQQGPDGCYRTLAPG
jgi:hypothetical protein